MTNRRAPNRPLLIALVLLLIVVAPLMLSLTPAWAQATRPPPTTVPQAVASPAPNATETNSVDEVLARADAAISAASRTTDQASMVLGFIQAISILIGAIAALGGAFLGASAFRTLRDYDTQLKDLRTVLANEATESEAIRARLQAQTTTEIDEMKKIAAQQVVVAQDDVKRIKEESRRINKALTLLQLGEGLFESGNITAAIRIYDEAHQLDPNNRATNYQLGELYILERNLPKAVHHLELVLKEDKDFAPAIAALGYAWRLEGDKMTDLGDKNKLWSKAEQKLIEAIQLDPNVRDGNKQSAYGMLAALYKRQERYKDAIVYYEKAEALTPNSSYPIVNLAQLYFMRGELDNSRPYFKKSRALAERALMNNPTDFWALFDVATSDVALEAPDWKRELTNALKQAPTGPLDTLFTGLMYLKNSPHPPSVIDEALKMVSDEMAARKA